MMMFVAFTQRIPACLEIFCTCSQLCEPTHPASVNLRLNQSRHEHHRRGIHEKDRSYFYEVESFLSILFNSSLRRQFSRAKLSPSSFNWPKLNPLKYLAHSGTKNSLNSSFRITREIQDSNFHTGQG